VSRPALATVRYFIDADLRGLAKLVCQERSDTTYLGDLGATIRKRRRPECPIPATAIKDVEWIPEVAARGWLIITRDRRIQQHTRERHAVRDNGAKMVNLDSADANTIWSQLEVLLTRWRDIEQVLAEPGPFIYSLSRTGAKRRVALD
jgi:hypothetical protein